MILIKRLYYFLLILTDNDNNSRHLFIIKNLAYSISIYRFIFKKKNMFFIIMFYEYLHFFTFLLKLTERNNGSDKLPEEEKILRKTYLQITI